MAKDIDIKTLSLEELRTLEKAANERIAQLEEEKRQKALQTIEQAAADVDMTPMELLKYFGLTGRGKKKAKSSSETSQVS